MSTPRVGIRWTIGDVSERGYEALRLSTWGAWKMFGLSAEYAVCVNTLPLAQAIAQAGEVPEAVRWYGTNGELPDFLRPHLDEGMAEGVAWKFSPLRMFPDRYEISLDNDCILWDMPTAIRQWLEAGDERACVLAEDARAMFGQFADFCGPEPRNTGIRGMPPRFDLGEALRRMLELHPVHMASELDEQGLQVAALSRERPPHVVSVREVTICSPFPPHLPYLGSHGAHFVGLNTRHYPWELDGRPAEEHIKDNWERNRAGLYERVGLGHPPEQASSRVA